MAFIVLNHVISKERRPIALSKIAHFFCFLDKTFPIEVKSIAIELQPPQMALEHGNIFVNLAFFNLLYHSVTHRNLMVKPLLRERAGCFQWIA